MCRSAGNNILIGVLWKLNEINYIESTQMWQMEAIVYRLFHSSFIWHGLHSTSSILVLSLPFYSRSLFQYNKRVLYTSNLYLPQIEVNLWYYRLASCLTSKTQKLNSVSVISCTILILSDLSCSQLDSCVLLRIHYSVNSGWLIYIGSTLFHTVSQPQLPITGTWHWPRVSREQDP